MSANIWDQQPSGLSLHQTRKDERTPSFQVVSRWYLPLKKNKTCQDMSWSFENLHLSEISWGMDRCFHQNSSWWLAANPFWGMPAVGHKGQPLWNALTPIQDGLIYSRRFRLYREGAGPSHHPPNTWFQSETRLQFDDNAQRSQTIDPDSSVSWKLS